MCMPNFTALMVLLRSGDPEAAALLHRRFAGQLIYLTRRHLGEHTRRHLDAEDVVQAAFHDFFRLHRRGRLRPTSWANLWAVLKVIALRECGHRLQALRAARRDVRRQVSLDGGTDAGLATALRDRGPTGAEAAEANDLLARLENGLGEPERQVLALQLHGYTIPEIGDRTGRAARTVRRLLQRVRSRFCRLLEAG